MATTPPTIRLNAELSAIIRAVAVVASDDGSRPVLTGVHFIGNARRKTLIIEATDSYAAHRATIGNFTTKTFTALVPATQLVSAVRALKCKAGATLTFKDGRAEISNNVEQRSFRLIEGNYPNVETLFAKNAEAEVDDDPKWLNPAKLRRTLEACALADTHQRGVKFRPAAHLGPIEFNVIGYDDNCRFDALLMPLRPPA